MYVKTLTLAAFASAALAAPAFAGSPAPAPVDPVVPAPAPVMPVSGDWTGAYGGLSLGYGDGTHTGVGSDTGLLYGLSLGYDYDMGNWVVGGGLDYDWTELSLGGNDLDNVARLKLRAGYDMGNGLLYGTAGGARAYSAAGDSDGWFGGLGYEHKITDHLSVGGEALYHNFSDFAGTTSDADLTTLSVKTNFRF